MKRFTQTVLCSLALSACGGMEDFDDEDLGVTQHPIINGDPITPTTPFVNVDGGCSGTLINADTVLTASHCITDGTVTVGTSSNLDAYQGSYTFYGYSDHNANDIMAMGIASDDRVYVWYDDWEVSSGRSDMLTRYRSTYSYSLAPGRTPSDILGMGIASNDYVYVWYDDGTVSAGTSSDLDRYRSPYSYSVAPGKSRFDIVAMAIAPNDRVYTWYDDGTVSVGRTNDLDYYTAPYAYSTAPGRSIWEIAGMAIAKSTSRVYAWYTDGGESNRPWTISLTSGTQSGSGTTVIRHPNLDVAIVRSNINFNTPNSASGGSAWPTLYGGSTASLLGSILDCYGYGRNTYDGGFGTLRRGDDLPVIGTYSTSYRIGPGQDNEIIWKGDSGGGCYRRSLFGNLIITGVNSTANHTPSKKRVNYATQVSIPTIRAWVQAND